MISAEKIIKEIAEILKSKGFKPLTEMTPDNVQSGQLVVLFNAKTSDFETVISRTMEKSNEGFKFYYIHKNSESSWSNAMLSTDYFKDYLYKVIA